MSSLVVVVVVTLCTMMTVFAGEMNEPGLTERERRKKEGNLCKVNERPEGEPKEWPQICPSLGEWLDNGCQVEGNSRGDFNSIYAILFVILAPECSSACTPSRPHTRITM